MTKLRIRCAKCASVNSVEFENPTRRAMLAILKKRIEGYDSILVKSCAQDRMVRILHSIYAEMLQVAV